MQTMKNRIIDCSLEQLGASGLRKFTMESVASGLRISKRTLYQHFRSKDQLLEACLKEWLHRKRLFEQSGGMLLDELCVLYAGIRTIDLRRAGRFGLELRRCCLPVYRSFLDRLGDYAEACGRRAEQDIEAGYLCRTVSPGTVRAVVSDLLIRLFGNDSESRFYRNEPLLPEILVVFARGLCTIKGRAYLDRRLKTLM